MNAIVFDLDNKQKGFSFTGKAVFIISLSWFAVIVATALSGGFETDTGERPLIMLLAVLMPVAVFSIAYLNMKIFKDWVLALDMRRLILMHSWRMVGTGFVFLYFQDRLPALFALPAGLGDAMAAIGALFLGIALYERAETVTRKRIFFWNTFGLIDFVIAVSMGVLTREGEVLYFSGQAGSNIMGSFPLVLIPGFAVPFYVITHLIIYAQLKRAEGL